MKDPAAATKLDNGSQVDTEWADQWTYFSCCWSRRNTFSSRSLSCTQQRLCSEGCRGKDSVQLEGRASCFHCGSASDSGHSDHRHWKNWAGHSLKIVFKAMIHLHRPLQVMILDRLVKVLQHILWEVFAVVELAQIINKLWARHFSSDILSMKIGVKQHDGTC